MVSDRCDGSALTQAIGEFVAAASDAELPSHARTRVLHSFVDTVAVALAAADHSGVDILRNSLQPLRPGTASLWTTEERTTALDAVLLNATAAHALDFDDNSEASYGHLSAVLVPVILALAEERPGRVGDLVAAYAAGYQVQTALAAGLRIRQHYAQGWHATGVLGPLGAAVAAAQWYRLTPEQTRRAVGIAVSRACGSTSNFGSWTKPLHVGHAARDGLWATQLAAHGFTAGEFGVEGPGGLLGMFGDADHAQTALDQLRDGWAVITRPVDLKPYPCCSAARCAIDAARQLASTQAAARIQHVRVTVEPAGLDALVHPWPGDGDQARFSLPFLVAAALVDGQVSLATFTDEAVARPELRAVAARVTADTAPVPPSGPASWHDAYAVAEVTWDDGTTSMARADAPTGQAWSWHEVEDKFRACLRRAARRWDTERLLTHLRTLTGDPDAVFHSPFAAHSSD